MNDKYAALEEMRNPSFKGELLVEVVGMQFVRAQEFFSGKAAEVLKVDWPIGIFLWVNAKYLEAHPPPLNIEEMYARCISDTCFKSELTKLHHGAFLRSFPIRARGNACDCV